MFENINLIVTALVAFVSVLKLLQCYRSYDSIVGNNVYIAILSILIFMYILFWSLRGGRDYFLKNCTLKNFISL